MVREISILVLLSVNAWTDLRRKEIFPESLLLAAGSAWVFRKYMGIRMGGYGILPFFPGILFLAASVCTDGKAGMGDALLLLVLGLYQTMEEIIEMLLMALAGASICAVFRRTLRGKETGNEIPLVPFLLLGYLLEFLV